MIKRLSARYVVSYSSHDGLHATLLRVVWAEQQQAEAHAAALRETPGITDVVVDSSERSLPNDRPMQRTPAAR